MRTQPRHTGRPLIACPPSTTIETPTFSVDTVIAELRSLMTMTSDPLTGEARAVLRLTVFTLERLRQPPRSTSDALRASPMTVTSPTEQAA